MTYGAKSAKCEKIRELNKEKEAFRWTLDRKFEFQELKKKLLSSKGIMAYDRKKKESKYLQMRQRLGTWVTPCVKKMRKGISEL